MIIDIFFFVKEIIDILYYIIFGNERFIFRVVYNYILNNFIKKNIKLILLIYLKKKYSWVFMGVGFDVFFFNFWFSIDGYVVL